MRFKTPFKLLDAINSQAFNMKNLMQFATGTQEYYFGLTKKESRDIYVPQAL